MAEKIGALAKGGQGKRIALVSGLESGTLARLMDEWVRAVGARPRVAYEAIGYESMRAANRAVFGRDAIPHYAIAEAGYLLSFGADFLETWVDPLTNSVAYAQMHGVRERARGHGDPDRAASVHDRRQCRRVGAERARARKACWRSRC